MKFPSIYSYKIFKYYATKELNTDVTECPTYTHFHTTAHWVLQVSVCWVTPTAHTVL